MDDATLKLLMVDDNPLDAELGARALRKAGVAFTHVVASGEAELRAALAEFEPDAVLCDFQFPDFDGIEAVAIVRECWPGTPVIFVSGTISEERAVIALRSGAVDYVLKSNLVRLPAALEHAVREARARRGLEASLRVAESGLVRQLDRLGALWRIANDPTLHGLGRMQAMLNESVAAIRAGQPFRGLLWRIEERELVCVALTPVGDGMDSHGRRYPPGTRVARADTSVAIGRRTQYWDEATGTAGLPEGARALGWRAEISTRFVAGNAEYLLAFGSREPALFDPDDLAYVEVLADSFASELVHGELVESLRAADARLRRHAERLETLWRIANDPSLRGTDRVAAMLTESASAIRPDQHFRGIISRIAGESLEVLHLTPDADGAGNARYPIGTQLPIGKTVAAQHARTRSWDDIATEADVPPTAVELGWHSVITTRFETASSTYVLTYGSSVPTEFGPDDVAYVEALASSFAKQFELDDSERRTRRHAERLEALWRIINNPNLRDEELWLAMLRESASAIRPGQAYHGRFVRVEADTLVREAIVDPLGYVPSAAEAAADAVERFAVAGTVAEELLRAGGRHALVGRPPQRTGRDARCARARLAQRHRHDVRGRRQDVCPHVRLDRDRERTVRSARALVHRGARVVLRAARAGALAVRPHRLPAIARRADRSAQSLAVSLARARRRPRAAAFRDDPGRRRRVSGYQRVLRPHDRRRAAGRSRRGAAGARAGQRGRGARRRRRLTPCWRRRGASPRPSRAASRPATARAASLSP
jgi:CheY-like chemotaxis protein